MPPPVRRIAVDREPTVAPPRPAAREQNGGGAAAAVRRPRAAAASRGQCVERMRLESVWLAYGENWVVRDVSAAGTPGRGAGADRRLRLGQDDAAALAQPAHRDHRGRGAQRAHHARRPRHPRARGQRAAPPRVDGLPAAQPVPDEHLRQRRLRARRAAPAGTRAPAPAHARDRRAPSRTRCGARASTRRSPATSTARR